MLVIMGMQFGSYDTIQYCFLSLKSTNNSKIY